MASSNKQKKGRTKLPKGRPASTSAISHPVVEDASYLTALSAFSPKGKHFAFLSLAVDKHRLRIYDTISGQSVAEHIVDSARVSALTWSAFDPFDEQGASSYDAGAPPSKKKRKKRNSLAVEEGLLSTGIEVVIMGLSDGTVVFFSPTHGRVLRTLSHSTSTAGISSMVVTKNGDNVSAVWTSGADGVIRLWDARKNDILGSWKNDDRIPYASMAIRPTEQDGQVVVLAAHHSIRLLSITSDITDFDIIKPAQIASFTGHASSIRRLQWDASQTPSKRFLSLAEADRFVYIWETPEGSSIEGKPIASIPLDADARTFSLSVLHNSPSTNERQTLLTLTASGQISIFPFPLEFAPPASSNRLQHKIPTLLPRSNLATSSKGPSAAKIVDAAFVAGKNGSIRVARIVGGIRPVFDIVRYLDDSGEFIQNVTIDGVEARLDEGHVGAPTQRYAEPSSLAIASGAELGQDKEMDELALRNVDGDLDVDLAELSLGQRLTALSGANTRPATDSDDEAATKKPKPSKKQPHNDLTVVPANSLTRTLIQALHSSDSGLLETCLAHSDQTLISNTIKRLPPQLAVPLITACVERLGRGARAGNMKGGGGGASSQRGTGLIKWVKITLAVHSGHLMTIPDLVARLSGLHATLTTRLTLQDSLLSLSGRLDMVLSQIEMRSSVAPASIVPQKGKEPSQKQSQEVERYVEGESDSESDEDEQMNVEMESGDDGGSVEDVELGGDSDEDDEMSEVDEGEDEGEDEDDDDEGPTLNGFIDDEAEEYSDEDEDSE